MAHLFDGRLESSSSRMDTGMMQEISDANGTDTAAVTRLLGDTAAGDPRATAALLPLVYNELRRLARQKMRAERIDHTLQATALVHEVFVRLAGSADGATRQWDGRWHFFAAAAEAMRRILVEQARSRGRQKRGGDRVRASLDSCELAVDEPPEDLIALDEALEEFSKSHTAKAQLVKLKYFAGLTTEEAALALGISRATAERHWAYARAWLFRHMGGQAHGA
jgi:RNA polymerase sigma factor (TIGR02999 family)